MTVALTYTVADVLREALSGVGVEYDNTEAANRQHAHKQLNIMLGGWSADPDLAIGRAIPVTGYAELTDTVDVPPEYIAAIVPNLSLVLAPHYDQKPDKLLVASASMTLENLKRFNVYRQSGRIPSNGNIV